MIRRALAGLLLVVVATASSVLVATLTVRQEEVPEPATTDPPSTAPVVEERLDRRLLFHGTVERVEQPIDSTGIVSALPTEDGEEIAWGAPVLELEGRPVLALPLPFPLWRDLRTGDRGRDVEALQVALEEAGLHDGQVTGDYDEGTRAAVARLYEEAGYEAPAEAREDDPGTGADEGDGQAPPDGGALLPASEVVSAPDEEIELHLSGTRVGDVLAEGQGPALRTREVQLVVADGGTLAEEATDEMPLAADFDGEGESEHAIASVEVDAEGDSRIALADGPSGLPPGQTVSGGVILDATSAEVLAAPSAAIRSTEDGHAVRVPQGDDDTREVEVEVGFRGDELDEIDSPEVEAGDDVVVSD